MPNECWGFEVKRVDLDGLCIDAGRPLGMVIAQPEYQLVRDGEPPFRILADDREAQATLIERAFEIRNAEGESRGVFVPFVVFPEAAIPVGDPDGLAALGRQMEQVQEDVIFIGGLEGLTPGEVQQVTEAFPPTVEAARPHFWSGAFVNLCVIAVKWASGRLDWHYQAKVAPSKLEQHRNMAPGGRILYFQADHLAFLCQICFDQIAAQGQQPLYTALCRQLIERSQPDAVSLDFVFVPQYNPKPDHRSVRMNSGGLLNYRDRLLNCDMVALVAVNRAARVQEHAEYGRSGVHYKAGRWQVPTSDTGPKGYELYESDRVTSAVFRKRTPAIHVATWSPPSYNVGEPGNPRLPLENPRSYLVTGACDPPPCSCLPRGAGAAGNFVECDCLPCKLRDTLLAELPAADRGARWEGPDETQSRNLAAHYREIRGNILALSCRRAGELLDLLFYQYCDGKANPDTWTGPRVGAVVELAAALCVLREWQHPLELAVRKEWTAAVGDSLAVVLLDGHYTCPWHTLQHAYWQAFRNHYHRPEMRQRVVLLVALRSDGRQRDPVEQFRPDIAEPRNRASVFGEGRVTEPQQLRIWICQGNLLAEARRQPSIKSYLESTMGCVFG